MAKILLDNGNFLVISKSDADAADTNIASRLKTEIDISDSDFNGYITNQKGVSIDGSTATFTDYEAEPQAQDEASLQNQFDIFTTRANDYLKGNSSKQFGVRLKAYVDYLPTVDKSSLTYPINWEKHCLDNSIDFVHIHEIG
tara:strand:+ start:1555 stop:1980 length:426 start_codon:yes stop_codon:yes gene_type:complete